MNKPKTQSVADIDILLEEHRGAMERRAQEQGREFGKCDVCEMETILVEETGLCGPCCFGEADTINGNW